MPIAVVNMSETFCRSRSYFQCFGFTITRRRIRHQRFEQMMSGMRDFVDCSIEGVLVCFRRFGETGQLSNKLERRRPNLVVCRRR